MTKIAIISQAEQGVLIDISGCSSLPEAKQYLTSTLQVSSQFWEGLIVDLNLGPLVLTPEQVNEIQAIVSEVGVQPRQIFSLSPITRSSLMQCRLPLGGLGQLQGYASMRALETPGLKQETQSAQYANELDYGESGISDTAANAGAPVLSRTAENYYSEAGKMPALPGQSSVPARANAVLDGSIESGLPGQGSLPARATTVLDGSIESGFSQASPAEQIANLESASLPDFQVAGQAVFPVESYFVPETSPVQNGFSMPNHQIAQAQAKVPAKAQAKAPLAAPKAPVAAKPAQAAVLMMKQTLRSGQRVCHKGHLVIIGDVNPGAELIADGDITVWGALRGMAHAGASGNTASEIRALKFDPIQLRIAQAIARSPDRSKTGGNVPAGPETARVIDGKIRLSVSDPE